MSRLARTNKVLYVEPQISNLRNGLGSCIKSWIGKGEKDECLRHIVNGLWGYKHPSLGFKSNWKILNWFGILYRIFAIRRALMKLQMKHPIVWIVNPQFGDMVRYLEKSLVCYHVVDNYSAAPYWTEQHRKLLARAEKYMLSIADIVIVTSPFLLEKQRKHNNNVLLVKNAVDYERFTFQKEAKKIPEDITNISKPIIGYVGGLNEKVDCGLINKVALARPNWSFIFVGQCHNYPGSEVEKLLKDPPTNVHILGQRNVEEVPNYIHACNVCILPYRCDRYTEGIDSLKRYEYFACEKPVVSTDVPFVREDSQVVYIAKNANDFVQKLEEALVSTDLERCALQRSIALHNTWDKRVEQLSHIIQDSLSKKSLQN